MIVRHDDGRSAVRQCLREHFAWMNRTAVDQTNRHDADVQDFIRSINCGAEKMLLLSVGVVSDMRQQVSREYLATQADFNANRNLYLTHYFEIDFNRAWRRQISGGAINLSNTYFNATYYPSAKISLNVSYDARRLIRTWETKTIADSLFDQSLRQGWRASVSLQPSVLTRLAFDGGWQGQKNSPDVFSAGISASTANLLRSGASLSGRVSYFGIPSSVSMQRVPSVSWGV